MILGLAALTIKFGLTFLLGAACRLGLLLGAAFGFVIAVRGEYEGVDTRSFRFNSTRSKGVKNQGLSSHFMGAFWRHGNRYCSTGRRGRG